VEHDSHVISAEDASALIAAGAKVIAPSLPGAFRRHRTPHTGVKLKPRKLPSGTVIFVARWREDGVEREASLSTRCADTDEARTEWCIKKARELADKRHATA
jgi:hypothetical protein